MTVSPAQTALTISLAFFFALGSGAARAQTPAPGAALPGTPEPERVQPWGLPPPPPGIGPVSLFADIHDSPQGKFLEGGAFDKSRQFLVRRHRQRMDLVSDAGGKAGARIQLQPAGRTRFCLRTAGDALA